jgi:hypothetical protein
MCFSAPVSFAASAALTVAGVATVRRKCLPGEIFLACIPFLFAIQQGIEGLQWIAIRQGETSLLLGYAFLFFAFLIWPVYIPFAVYKVEHLQVRKNILRVCIVAGFAIATWLLFVLAQNPLAIYVHSHGIQYSIAIPPYIKGLYAVVTIGSLFVSSSNYLKWFGCAVALSFFITHSFFNITFISTWCFSAAALSIILYFYFKTKKPIASKNTRK